MLARFFSGLLHSLIHTGYGVKFALPGMIVEVHRPTVQKLIPNSLFDVSSNVLEAIGGVISKFTSHLSLNTILPASVAPVGVHALTILARVLKDSRFDNIEKTDNVIADTISKHGDALLEYANQWTLTTAVPKVVEDKIEELVWFNVLIYGLGGWKKGED